MENKAKSFKLEKIIKCICNNPGCEIQIYSDKSDNDKLVILPICSDIVQYPINFSLSTFLKSKNTNIFSNKIFDYATQFIDEVLSVAVFPVKFIYNVLHYVRNEFIFFPSVELNLADLDDVKKIFPDYAFVENEENTGYSINNYYIFEKELINFKTKLAFFIDGYAVIQLKIFVSADKSEERVYDFETLLSR